ncbi:MAG TPA: glycosyltransferase [Usitatibacter sp.]|nr:glycosyltransferase [Usitatibacter sp.]
MAAGTGGHIFPGIAIAKELVSRGWSVHWMGTRAGMENKLVAEAGYPMVRVNMSGVRGKGALAWLTLPVKILVAFWQSTVAIFRIRPDVVLSMGGYVAFPGGMMAALWGKPLVVHEPGAVAGIANRVLAPVADRVIVGMEGAFERKVAQKWANALPKPKRVDWLGTAFLIRERRAPRRARSRAPAASLAPCDPCCLSEDVEMRNVDFAPYYRSSVGYDRMLNALGRAQRTPEAEAAMPPYDIESVV